MSQNSKKDWKHGVYNIIELLTITSSLVIRTSLMLLLIYVYGSLIGFTVYSQIIISIVGSLYIIKPVFIYIKNNYLMGEK